MAEPPILAYGACGSRAVYRIFPGAAPHALAGSPKGATHALHAKSGGASRRREIIGAWLPRKRRARPAPVAEAATRAKVPQANAHAGSWHLAAVPGAWTRRMLRSQWIVPRSVR